MAANRSDLTLGTGARSERGRREENQDKMTAFPTSLGTVYIVADGMGGHRGGAEASHRVIEGYRTHLSSFQEGAGLPDVLQAATVLTNAEILEAGHSGDPSIAGMGSTVVIAVLRISANGMELLTGHIGDSRAYLLREGALHRLTRDHSAVQRMVDAQILTPEAARSHPDSNVLTRALGQQPDVTIDVSEPKPLQAGDTVLLCSDGLWGYVSDEQILHELTLDRSASEAADALVDLALAQGSDDNITLQVLRLEDHHRALSATGALRRTLADGFGTARFLQRKATPAPVEAGLAAPARSSARSLRIAIYGVAIALCIVVGAMAWVLVIRHNQNPAPLPPLPNTASPSGKPNSGTARPDQRRSDQTPPPASHGAGSANDGHPKRDTQSSGREDPGPLGQSVGKVKRTIKRDLPDLPGKGSSPLPIPPIVPPGG
jgi:PPM family protein phosphatase